MISKSPVTQDGAILTLHRATAIWLVIFALAVHESAFAHPENHDSEQIHQTVVTLANGLLNADVAEISPLLHPDFVAPVFAWAQGG